MTSVATDQASAIDAWCRQLREQAAPYVQLARDRSHGVQVVLTLRPNGALGSPKITMTTGEA